MIEIFVLLLVPRFIFWIWSLLDALRRPDADWEQAGQNKLVWVLVLIFIGFIGSIIYLLVARPALENAKRGY
ncbi:MAG: hypothetical protein GY773_27560 [Actinomycetia bacterium]|nr:hypothetical protein [Actinomycetes bacterium]